MTVFRDLSAPKTMLTQDEVNAKARAVQDACLFKQSESHKGFSAFDRVFKQEGTKQNS